MMAEFPFLITLMLLMMEISKGLMISYLGYISRERESSDGENVQYTNCR